MALNQLLVHLVPLSWDTWFSTKLVSPTQTLPGLDTNKCKS
jgi:hypothetical protein